MTWYIASPSYIDYIPSKVSASVLTVDEHQSLESITQEKTASHTWSQLFEKEREFEERKAVLMEEFPKYKTARGELPTPLVFAVLFTQLC